MLWAWGEEKTEREREREGGRNCRRGLETQRGRNKTDRGSLGAFEISPPFLPSSAGSPGVGAVSSWPSPHLLPQLPEKQAASPPPWDKGGVAGGAGGCVVWQGSSLILNQGSWRQLRVCNLCWGLMGGGGFAGGDNGREQSPGLEQGAVGPALSLLGWLEQGWVFHKRSPPVSPNCHLL